jgi:LysM repeat protein
MKEALNMKNSAKDTAKDEDPVQPVAVHEPAKKKINPYKAPAKTPVSKPKPAPKKAAAPKKVDKPAPKVYTVKSGDTLGAIAKRNKTTVAALKRLNNISNPNMIRVGQKIKLS